jgi:GT2 family glycosyltransferase
MIEIIMVSYMAKERLAQTLAGIARNTRPGYRLTLHDNTEKNYPLSWVWNQMVGASKREFIAVVNPDILVGPGWDTEAISCLVENKDCGIATPLSNYDGHMNIERIEHPDEHAGGKLQDITLGLHEKFRGERFRLGNHPHSIPGHCMVFRKESWKKVGGFDETIPFCGSDSAYSKRVADNGFSLGICLHAVILHYWHSSVQDGWDAGTIKRRTSSPRFSSAPKELT